ncbi:MAG: chorismate-binding protein [Bacteroidetes bacterium]|nr:chorismate-binding protein [Bacteroidota bacterium]
MALAVWSYPYQKTFKAVEGQAIELDRLDHVRTSVFVVKPFNRNLNFNVIVAKNAITLESTTEWITKRLILEKHKQTEITPRYLELVKKAKKQFSTNHSFTKVVLSRSLFQESNSVEFKFLDQLRSAYPSAYISLFSSPNYGTWVTASPELLLSCINQELCSYSLAGTRINGQQEIGEKEKNEQAIVTNAIEKAFKEHGFTPIIKATELGKSGDLEHLCNQILAATEKVESNTILNLLHDLHPTPAVGGHERNTALNFIEENEGHNRALYSGFLGEFNSISDFSFFVNLRCAQLFSNGIKYYAGAGITANSIPEKELAETEAKMNVLKSVLSPNG